MYYSRYLILLFLILIPKAGFGVDTLVVTGSRILRIFSHLNRQVSIITAEEISRLPVHSVADVLDQVLSSDIQRRGPYGVQADVALRGSTFEQVLVLVDGVRINDPQTGHHNLDVPVTLNDVERIEILHGHGSSVYGPDAFGGVINIITRKPLSHAFTGTLGYAEYNTLEYAGSHGFKKGPFGSTVSAARQQSDGYRYDTDFKNTNLFNQARLEYKNGKTDVSLGYSDKEFGAYHFYSVFTEDDRERTTSGFAHMNSEYRLVPKVKILGQLHYRKHSDRYQYTYGTSQYENRHQTDSYGGEAQGTFSFKDRGAGAAGMMYIQDEIESSNMGNHIMSRYAVFGEYNQLFFNKWGLDLGLRMDRHSSWGTALSPTVALSFWPQAWGRIHASVGQAFRRPTYTELYYVTSTNQGNPDLVPEKTFSYEAGITYDRRQQGTASLTGFFRDQEDVIDWVKDSLSAPVWRAENTGRNSMYGAETRYRIKKGPMALQLHYTWTEAGESRKSYVSKYALRYLRHHANLSVTYCLPWEITPFISLAYKERPREPSYFVLNAKVSKRMGSKFLLSAEGTNLLDEQYEEILGVERPGRWLGIKLEVEL